MARITRVEKCRKSPGDCRKCRKTIAKGAPYRWFQKYRSAKFLVCDSCTIRGSDTAGGRMCEVYACQEEATDAVGEWDGEEKDDLDSLLDDAAEQARDLGGEYEASAEAIRENFSESPTADECDEKRDALEEWADAMENAKDNIEEKPEPEEVEPADPECPKCEGTATVREDESFEPDDDNAWKCDDDDCKEIFTRKDEDEPDAVSDEDMQSWIDNARSTAEEAIGELSI
jgi:hypothetical protein